MRTSVRVRRAHDPARGPGLVLRLGRAARRPATARPSRDRRRRRGARGQLRGQGVRRPDRDGRGAGAPALPAGGRGAAADGRPTRRRARPSSRSSRTPRRWSRGSRSTRPSSTFAGCERISGTPTEIAARLRRRVLDEVGLPITVGVARTKFLAKVASAVAKPDGLLVVPPDGELEFLHPLPVERLWGVGRVTAAKLRDRGITTVRQVADLGEAALVEMLGRGVGPAPPRARPQPRPAPRAGRAAAPLDGRAARARPPLAQVARATSTPRWWRSSTGSPAGCAAPARVCRTVVLRLRFDDFSRATRSHTSTRRPRTRRRSSSRPGTCSPPRLPLIERAGPDADRDRARQPRERRRRPARAAARPPARTRRDPRRRARPLRLDRHHARGAARSRSRDLGPPAA